MATNSNELDAAIESLARVKDEHRVILEQVSRDAGMAPETRTSLILHLYEEEDEHLAEIQSLRAGATPAAPAAGGPQRPGLTVGSLRSDPASAAGPAGLSVGSLRR